MLNKDVVQEIADFALFALYDAKALDQKVTKNLHSLLEAFASDHIVPRNISLLGIANARASVRRVNKQEPGLTIKVVKPSLTKFLEAHSPEVIKRARLEHPNIHPFYGIYAFDAGPTCIISPWVEWNLQEYIESHYDQRERALLIFDIISGLKYLHDENIIHGNLTCTGGQHLKSSTTGHEKRKRAMYGPSAVWFTIAAIAERELPYGPGYRRDGILASMMESCWRVEPKNRPHGWSDIHVQVSQAVKKVNGASKTVDEDVKQREKFWHDAKTNVRVSFEFEQVRDNLTVLLAPSHENECRDLIKKILANRELRDQYYKIPKQDAQVIVDYLEKVLRKEQHDIRDKWKLVILLSRLVSETDCFPLCYKLSNVFIKELTIWAHLSHPNILPFYGAFATDDNWSPISPWMARGNLSQYLSKHADSPRSRLTIDVVSGLQYLHDANIIHGDLKGPNVLISSDERAIITDFGLSNATTATAAGFTLQGSAFTGRECAPEMIGDIATDSASPAIVSPAMSSDIWAVACIIYEISSTRNVYFQYNQAIQVVAALKRRELPLRPDGRDGFREIDENVWRLLLKCWSFDPKARPSCREIHNRFHSLFPDYRSIATESPEMQTAQETRAKLSPGIDFYQIETPHQEHLYKATFVTSVESTAAPKRLQMPPISSTIAGHGTAIFPVSFVPGFNTEPPVRPSWITALLSSLRPVPPDARLVSRWSLPPPEAKTIRDHLTLLFDLQRQGEGMIKLLQRNVVQEIADFVLFALYDIPSLGDGEFSALYFLLDNFASAAGVAPQNISLNGIKSARSSTRGTDGPEIKLSVKVVKAATVDALELSIKELIMWAHFSHPNILPLYGVLAANVTESAGLSQLEHRNWSPVSPWIEHGNLRDYLTKHPNSPRFEFILDVLNGLEYLHGIDIVHASLTSANILVSQNGRAIITEFGKSNATTATAAGFTNLEGFAGHECPPELLREVLNEDIIEPSKFGDIWSLACLIYEVRIAYRLL
ncbi:Serine/threonine-protein kinase CTR1 [Leucoagaricus sp. SymC.cos]|nr:Serine/threonine-protein kinase CTR1 [Leucoagaricus sp. SymC.cos]